MCGEFAQQGLLECTIFVYNQDEDRFAVRSAPKWLTECRSASLF